MTTPESSAGGVRAVVFATLIAGGLGYAIQVSAPALLTPAAYVAFASFWSALYLGAAALSGVQQEVTRAARPADGQPPSAVLRTFALLASVAVSLVVAILAFVVGDAVLPSALAFGVILTVGLCGYLATAVLSGVLYGLHLWRAVAGIVVADAVVRAVLLLVGFALKLSIIWLAALIALPFSLAFALTWACVRRRVVGRFRLDVGLRTLSSHAAGTVLAALAAGVMITGLPMLIGITSAAAPVESVGALLLTITLTRAPIVVPVIALQSYMISAVFRDGLVSSRRLARIIGMLLAGVVAVAGVAWVLGPLVISFISAGRYSVVPAIASVVVFSAGLVAAMSITGPALIAARRHGANLLGWTVAAALTAFALLLPLQVDQRIALAVTVPPAIGLAIHGLLLLRSAGSPSTSAPLV